MIRLEHVILLIVGLSHPLTATGQASGAAGRVAEADRLLKTGRYREAQVMYAEAAQAARGNASLRASALFGKALAAQQGAAVDSVGGQGNDSALAAYRMARTLDSVRLFGAASNNAGLLLRAQGKHAEALRYFLDAASTTHRARAYFYLNAGREYEQLGQSDSAIALYHRSLKVDPRYGEARQALLDLYGRWPSPDSLVRLAPKWGADPASSGAVNEAILSFLSKPDAAISDAQGDSLLIAFSRNLVSAAVSPEQFGSAYDRRLADVEGRFPKLQEAIAALRDAFRERRPPELYREPSKVTWWQQWNGREGHRKVWSTVLRSLGDRYNESKSTDVAASFYEAAVGYPRITFASSWIDLDAMLPLGEIYVGRLGGAEQDPRAVERLNQLIDELFMGKGAAYKAGDLPRIRSFHITLGKMFADRGQWGDMYNPRSAVFQLERMQMVTRQMRQKDDPAAFDPPQLLEILAKGYFTTGHAEDGRRTAKVAATTYTRLGRAADASRLTRMVEHGYKPNEY